MRASAAGNLSLDARSVGALAPPLALMALIFWLGTDRASASETQGLLMRLLRALLPSVYAGLSPEALVTLNVIVRKGGHFFGYALLGLLNARALRLMRGDSARFAGPAWGAAALWAAVDEYHQSFSASRGAAVEDVLLDSCGAAAAILAYLLWIRRTHPRS